MAKQVTRYISRDRKGGAYHIWGRKVPYKRIDGYWAQGELLTTVCPNTIHNVISPAKMNKRGMKKLTIKIEDIE